MLRKKYVLKFGLVLALGVFIMPKATGQDWQSYDSQVFDEFEDAWRENLKASATLFEPSPNRGAVITEVSQSDLKKRLDYLNAATPMDLSYNSVVHGYVEKYLRMGQSYGRIMGLAEFYFPIFEEILAKYDIPDEIKYLAIVESNLNPRANSRVGAKGLWQFMYASGKAYGLEVNSYVDERYDPIKSTEAAAKYLSYLHKNLKDWNLALAAYNCGMGNVNKAISRSGGQRNYWNIRNHLPSETRGYVPSFVAANYIMRYYKQQNLGREKLKFSYYDTDTVHVEKNLTFKELSRTLNMSIEDIQFLNPQYKLDVIPKLEGKSYSLRLPKDKIRYFTANEAAIYGRVQAEQAQKEKTTVNLGTYQSLSQKYDPNLYYIVQSGDNLSKIGAKYGKSVQELMSLNGLKSTSLRIGQPIKYRNIVQKEYIVKEGDTLSSISLKFNGVSTKEIIDTNKLMSLSVQAGDRLRIPVYE